MDRVVIPNFRKLDLVFPDAVFELYQQMKEDDSLSFQAAGNKDVLFQVTLKKNAGSSTQINIETFDENNGVLDLEGDEWQCHLKGITSEAFLLTGQGSRDSSDDAEKNSLTVITSPNQTADLTSPITSPTSRTDINSLLPTEVDEHMTVIAPMATLDDSLQQELSSVTVSTSSELVHFVSPLLKTELPEEEEDPLPPTHIPTPPPPESLGGDSDDDNSGEEAEIFSAEAAEPDENANEGMNLERHVYKHEDTADEDYDQEGEDANVTLIVLGKKKKVTVKNGNTTEVIREAVETMFDKMVQSEAKELACFEERPAEFNEVTNESFDLDLSLNQTVSVDEQATNILKKLMEKEAKIIDPNSVVENFPIIKEDGKYKCHICSMLLLKRHYLVAHMRYVHKICVRDPLSLLQCPYCPATFTRKNRYNEHMIHKHTAHKPFVCDMEDCQIAFKTVYNLRDHKRIFHYHMLRYACDVCKKQYENPNTVVRHRKQCYKQFLQDNHSGNGENVEKTSEELRNPDWVPINELFSTIPRNRPRKKKKTLKIRERDEMGKPESEKRILKRKRRRLEEGEVAQEELNSEDEVDDNDESVNRESSKTTQEEETQGKKHSKTLLNFENIQEEDDVMDGENIEVTFNEEENDETKQSNESSNKQTPANKKLDQGFEVVNVTIVQDKTQTLGKRKVDESETATQDEEYPIKKKAKKPMANLKIISKGEEPMYTTVSIQSPKSFMGSESGRKSNRLAGQERKDYKKMADTLTSGDQEVTTQATTKDTIGSQKESENRNSSRKLFQENLEKNSKGKGNHLESTSEETAIKKLSFKVQGILNHSKVYTMEHDELCRRMYGPETMNTVTFMSFIKKEDGCSKIAEFKKKLISGGYLVPKFTSVTSSFSKLCEGEISDLLTDFKELQSEYFAEDKLVAAFLREIFESHEDKEIEECVDSTGIFLQHVKNNLENHIIDFDEVTHGFGSQVVMHLLKLYHVMMVHSLAKAKKRHVNIVRDETFDKKRRLRGSPSKKKKGSFTVTGILSPTATKHEVLIDEIERRSELPEQMGLTMLHSYLRKGKSCLNTLLEDCSQMGLILQKGNRTWVQSGFSRLIEAEAQKLCDDFDTLMKNHISVNKLVLDVVKSVSISTSKGQLTSILEAVGLVSPHLYTTIDRQCEDFDLVTHTVGQHLAKTTWTFVNDVAKKCSDYCIKS